MSIKNWFSKKAQPAATAPTTPIDTALSEVADTSIPLPEDLALTPPVIDPAHFGTEPTTPVDRQRLADYLIQENYKYSIDDDGDVVGVWDANPVWFMFMGPSKGFFQVRARWHRRISAANKLLALHAANDWNRDKLWPKVFLREDETEGTYSMFAELTFDYSEGASNKQFEYSVDYALKCSLQYFEHLETIILPDAEESTGQA